MSDGIIEEIAREHDDVLDVHRLIEAVRGSRAAKILFDYRSGPCFDTLSGDQNAVERHTDS